MENKINQERVLAYCLAKEIHHDDLDLVAGGYGTGAPISHWDTLSGRDTITDGGMD